MRLDVFPDSLCRISVPLYHDIGHPVVCAAQGEPVATNRGAFHDRNPRRVLYKQDQIELLQTPRDMPDWRVRIIMIPQDQLNTPARYLTLGKYQTGRKSTLDDFREAEWHGDAEFDPQHDQ
jgi:hypothetical protein